MTPANFKRSISRGGGGGEVKASGQRHNKQTTEPIILSNNMTHRASARFLSWMPAGDIAVAYFGGATETYSCARSNHLKTFHTLDTFLWLFFSGSACQCAAWFVLCTTGFKGNESEHFWGFLNWPGDKPHEPLFIQTFFLNFVGILTRYVSPLGVRTSWRLFPLLATTCRFNRGF